MFLDLPHIFRIENNIIIQQIQRECFIAVGPLWGTIKFPTFSQRWHIFFSSPCRVFFKLQLQDEGH